MVVLFHIEWRTGLFVVTVGLVVVIAVALLFLYRIRRSAPTAVTPILVAILHRTPVAILPGMLLLPENVMVRCARRQVAILLLLLLQGQVLELFLKIVRPIGHARMKLCVKGI